MDEQQSQSISLKDTIEQMQSVAKEEVQVTKQSEIQLTVDALSEQLGFTPTTVVILKKHYSAFHTSKTRKRHLTELLTRGGSNPNMEGAVLDITDTPMSRDAFNMWLLPLIQSTELTVVDNSMEFPTEEEGFVKFMEDGKEKELYMTPIQYPYEMDFSTGEYNEDDYPVRVTRVKVGDLINSGEIGVFTRATEKGQHKYRVHIIQEPVTIRKDVIDRVMLKRELDKEVEQLVKYCEEDDRGNKVFTPDSVNSVINYVNGLMDNGQEHRLLFGVKGISESKESAYNLAKLFIIANELIEMDQTNSGQIISTRFILPFVSQFTYDYSTYNAFVDDFKSRHQEGTIFIMCKTRGIYERVNIDSYRAVVGTGNVEKHFITISYLELGQTPITEEIELLQFYSLHRVALPEGYTDGTGNGLLDYDERMKYFERPVSEMKEMSELVNIDGISSYIGSGIHFSANTDYVKVYKQGLQEEYHALGLGTLPEIDLKEIVRGAESPYSHTALQKRQDRAHHKGKIIKSEE